MTLAVERERGMLGGRRAWWRSGRGQDIELAGEVGEGVHGREGDAEEGGLEDGGDGEGEEEREESDHHVDGSPEGLRSRHDDDEPDGGNDAGGGRLRASFGSISVR